MLFKGHGPTWQVGPDQFVHGFIDKNGLLYGKKIGVLFVASVFCIVLLAVFMVLIIPKLLI